MALWGLEILRHRSSFRGTGQNNTAQAFIKKGTSNTLSTGSGVLFGSASTKGLTLVVLTKDSTGTASAATTYDTSFTSGNTTNAGNLATALDGIDKGEVGILVSFGDWKKISPLV